jgi:NMD protein affecting ribosome stability and mRNA decay
MPYGSHGSQCHACGRAYLCGDCITETCPECRQKGHEDYGRCPICNREQQERDARRAKAREAGK